MNQPSIIVYGHKLSNCVQRVLLLLEEKGLTYDFRQVSLIDSEQLGDDFLAINPRGRVPAVQIGQDIFIESCDIMREIEKRFSDNSFIPQRHDEREVMEYFVEKAKASHPTVKDLVYSRGIGRLPTDEELAIYDRVDEENASFHHQRRAGKIGCDLEKATQAMMNDFKEIEQALEGKQWIAGPFSLADMAWFPNALIFRLCDMKLEGLPNVADWIARMKQRESYCTGLKHDVERLPGWLIRAFMWVKRRMQPSRY